MPKRPALTVVSALLLWATVLCACAPVQGPTSTSPSSTSPSSAGQVLPSGQVPSAGPGRRLALAAFHLRAARGGGPLAALQVLDAPQGPEDAVTGLADSAAGELALRALAFRQLGRNALAVAVLDRLMLTRLDLPPAALADAFVERGQALADLGHQARATEDFAAALRLAPRHIPALMARADQLFALERFAEAEAAYGAVVKAEPGNVLAHINRGVARDEQGRFAEAIADFTQALALDPESPAALMNRGVSRSQAGDMAGMCADYAAACRLGACHRLGEARAMGYCLDSQ